MTIRAHHAVLAAAALLVTAPGAVRAQANDEVDAGIQFNFSLPGARSMSMGGAFLGAADDATAAYTNPAGLTNLRAPEVSLEGRAFRFANDFVAGGHAPGEATGIGADTHTGLVLEEFHDTTVGVGFASVVMPRGDWSLALYRHELANFEAHGIGGGEFVTVPECIDVNPQSTCRRVFLRAELDLLIQSYGFAAAYRFGDRFSFGAGAAWHLADLDGVSERYVSTATGTFNTDPPLYSSGRLIATTIQHVDDGSPALNLGFLWKPLPWLGIGGVYRQGPKFDFDGLVIQGPNLINICATCFHDVAYDSTYHLPDTYGAGVTVRPPTIPLRVSLDVNRIRYSQIMDGFVNIVAGIANDTSFERGTPDYSIDDATEVRLGLEYVFTSLSWPLAVRAGAWHDPDHRLKNDGDALPTEKTRFPGGSDQLHATAGVGIVAAERFQLDLAVDLGESFDAASLSAVVFF